MGGSSYQQGSGGDVVHAACTGWCGATRGVPSWSLGSWSQLQSIHLQVFLLQQSLACASLHFASINFPFQLSVAERYMDF